MKEQTQHAKRTEPEHLQEALRYVFVKSLSQSPMQSQFTISSSKFRTLLATKINESLNEIKLFEQETVKLRAAS